MYLYIPFVLYIATQEQGGGSYIERLKVVYRRIDYRGTLGSGLTLTPFVGRFFCPYILLASYT